MHIQLKHSSSRSWSARSGGRCGFDRDFWPLTNPSNSARIPASDKTKISAGRVHARNMDAGGVLDWNVFADQDRE